MCVRGRAVSSEIDDWVDRWHVGTEPDSLADYLEMSPVEYARWIAHPESLAEVIAGNRLSRLQGRVESSGMPS